MKKNGYDRRNNNEGKQMEDFFPKKTNFDESRFKDFQLLTVLRSGFIRHIGLVEVLWDLTFNEISPQTRIILSVWKCQEIIMKLLIFFCVHFH